MQQCVVAFPGNQTMKSSTAVIPESYFDSDPKSLLFLTFGNESVVVEPFSATMELDTCSRVCPVGAGLHFFVGWKTTCNEPMKT